MTHHPRMQNAWTTRALVLAAAVGGTFLFGAGAAAAHVAVTPSSAEPGAEATELSFRVPNERSDATTTAVELALPTDHPFALASVRPMPGWKIQVTKQKLAQPLKSDDGPVTDAVTSITWTGGSIGVGQYEDFDVTIGPLPENPTGIVFKALQTYSDGSVVRWIDLTPAGSAEPEHPAPVLQVRAATAARQTARAATEPVATSSASTDWTARGLAGAGLLIALAAAALALGRRKATRLEQSPVTASPERQPATRARK
jgi:uncharacterized protein YcnI